MPAMEELTIHLPADAMESIRARVAAGELASTDELIARAISEFSFEPYSGPNDAFLEECARRYDHARANPSVTLTLGDAFSGLVDE